MIWRLGDTREHGWYVTADGIDRYGPLPERAKRRKTSEEWAAEALLRKARGAESSRQLIRAVGLRKGEIA